MVPRPSTVFELVPLPCVLENELMMLLVGRVNTAGRLRLRGWDKG
jgi:hypothetical protein